MSEKEKLQLENECLLKYSKAQMIQKYIDELEEIERLNNIIKDVREYIKENEKEYGSLEDNEKIILEILDKELN